MRTTSKLRDEKSRSWYIISFCYPLSNFNLNRGMLCMCMWVRTCGVHKCVIGVESVRVVLVGSAGHVQHHAPVRLRGKRRRL